MVRATDWELGDWGSIPGLGKIGFALMNHF